VCFVFFSHRCSAWYLLQKIPSNGSPRVYARPRSCGSRPELCTLLQYVSLCSRVFLVNVRFSLSPLLSSLSLLLALSPFLSFSLSLSLLFSLSFSLFFSPFFTCINVHIRTHIHASTYKQTHTHNRIAELPPLPKDEAKTLSANLRMHIHPDLATLDFVRLPSQKPYVESGVCVYVCVYVCVCVCAYVRMIRVYIYAFFCMCVCMCICVM
jgi:hypothetical protein